jgi:hypothetical protein
MGMRLAVFLCAAFTIAGYVPCVAQGAAPDFATISETLPDSSAQQSSSATAPSVPDSPRQSLPQKQEPPATQKLGPFNVTLNWRTRVEGWEWFQGDSGNSEYPFWHSQLRVGIGQNRENLDWFVEGEQVALAGLPNNAVVAAPQGQLGLGGNYYAANGNDQSTASGFLKQGFVNFKHLGPAALKIGRFEYFDGLEVKPTDPFLAAVVQARVSSRLISNFGYSAVQRSFDGVQLALNSGSNNFTFLGARPTQGVFQVHGMDELDVDTYYGAYTRSVHAGQNSGELRVFALGYIDHRTLVLKTDNRSTAIRAADLGKIEIATWGADYVHVINTTNAGKFDFLAWGAVQTGAWGDQTQRAGAFVGEAGWKPPVRVLKPWLSAGYSYGSGDGNPSDSRHGTFFQVLTTPRQYARFPFYNMMNNEDFYGAVNASPTPKLTLRTEAHALRLASASDLWYLGGGAFQPKTFGFTGRPSNGNRGLANVWDISGDYQINRYFGATLYYGHAWGKSVIEKIYPKDADGMLAYLETNVRF